MLWYVSFESEDSNNYSSVVKKHYAERSRVCLILILLYCLIDCEKVTYSRNLIFNFYSEKIFLKYDASVIIKYKKKFAPEEFYNRLNQNEYNSLLNCLLAYRDTLKLNDWLYYQFVEKCTDQIFKKEKDGYKRLFCWFILGKSGFDVRVFLCNDEDGIILSVFTNDTIYYAKSYEINKKKYIFLPPREYKDLNIKSISKFVINENGNPFLFKMIFLPQFRTPKVVEKIINFRMNDEEFTFSVQINLDLINIMKGYPKINYAYYVRVPLSYEVMNSLINNLKNYLKDKDEKSTIKFLLSFTRAGFKYEEDPKEYNNGYRPYIAEETLYYDTSDCEDRSALFYNLVKELLRLPMIIVDYPEHLSIAVKLHDVIGEPIIYKGMEYSFCDPTGPSNSSEIGIYPRGYEKKGYVILGE